MKPPELPVHALRPAIGLTKSRDRAVISASDEGTASRDDIRERAAAYRYFEHAAVEGALQVEVVAERQLRGRR